MNIKKLFLSMLLITSVPNAHALFSRFQKLGLGTAAIGLVTGEVARHAWSNAGCWVFPVQEGVLMNAEPICRLALEANVVGNLAALLGFLTTIGASIAQCCR